MFEGSNFSTALPAWVTICLFDYSHPIRCEVLSPLVLSCISFFYFFCFLRLNPPCSLQVPRLGVESELYLPQQLGIRAASAACTTAHSNTGSLTHWSGIDTYILMDTIHLCCTTRELLDFVFPWWLIMLASFHALIGCLYIFFGEMSLQILCPFFNWGIFLCCSFPLAWAGCWHADRWWTSMEGSARIPEKNWRTEGTLEYPLTCGLSGTVWLLPYWSEPGINDPSPGFDLSMNRWASFSYMVSGCLPDSRPTILVMSRLACGEVSTDSSTPLDGNQNSEPVSQDSKACSLYTYKVANFWIPFFS